MTPDELRQHALEALASVAPEMDPTTLKSDVSIRDQIDIDSMDFYNFILALHNSLGVDIPERDYPKLATIDGCVEYLASTLPR